MRPLLLILAALSLMACATPSPLKDQHKDQLQCTGGTDPVIKARVLALETQPDESLVVDGELWAAIIQKADLKVLDIIEGQCIKGVRGAQDLFSFVPDSFSQHQNQNQGQNRAYDATNDDR